MLPALPLVTSNALLELNVVATTVFLNPRHTDSVYVFDTPEVNFFLNAISNIYFYLSPLQCLLLLPLVHILQGSCHSNNAQQPESCCRSAITVKDYLTNYRLDTEIDCDFGYRLSISAK